MIGDYMRLPNGGQAHIPGQKLRGYLLSDTHPIGRAKARVLNSAGFDQTNVEMLEQSLTAIARDQEVTKVIPFLHGTKYVIEGLLEAPSGTRLQVRTVWIIETGADTPRFVTVYPI